MTVISTEDTCDTPKVNWTIDSTKIDEATSQLEGVDEASIKNMVDLLNAVTPKRIVACLGEIKTDKAISNGADILLGLFTKTIAQLKGPMRDAAMGFIKRLGDKNLNCAFLEEKLAVENPELEMADGLKIFRA